MKRRIRWKRKIRRPPLSEEEILRWIDEFYALHKRWPKQHDGWIGGTLDEKWPNVDMALRLGLRGLPGGSSLARLLAEKRGVRNHAALPRLSQSLILEWADAWHQRTGFWPIRTDGPIEETGETWLAVDAALLHGNRGLPGGSSLARLLNEERGVRHLGRVPPLLPLLLLSWIDAHRTQFGAWPRITSGPVSAAPGETWSGINTALQDGLRGLPGGSSLPQFLAEHRGVRNHKGAPRLTQPLLLGWIDAYFQANGDWPDRHSGPIEGSGGDTWSAIEQALSQGGRGLPGGSSLAQFLAEHRGVRNRLRLPRLTLAQIRQWAEEYHRTQGTRPTRNSGGIAGSGGETWSGIDSALKSGGRGLPGGSSLSQFLAEHGSPLRSPCQHEHPAPNRAAMETSRRCRGKVVAPVRPKE